MSMSINNTKNAENWQKTQIFEPGDDAAYVSWRDNKLLNYPEQRNESIVTVSDMANPQGHEVSQILNHCEKTNMAIYDCSEPILAETLENFCRHLGLITMETHRSADKGGVVAIEQATYGGKGGYIPYTNKPLSWHTTIAPTCWISA